MMRHRAVVLWVALALAAISAPASGQDAATPGPPFSGIPIEDGAIRLLEYRSEEPNPRLLSTTRYIRSQDGRSCLALTRDYTTHGVAEFENRYDRSPSGHWRMVRSVSIGDQPVLRRRIFDYSRHASFGSWVDHELRLAEAFQVERDPRGRATSVDSRWRYALSAQYEFDEQGRPASVTHVLADGTIPTAWTFEYRLEADEEVTLTRSRDRDGAEQCQSRRTRKDESGRIVHEISLDTATPERATAWWELTIEFEPAPGAQGRTKHRTCLWKRRAPGGNTSEWAIERHSRMEYFYDDMGRLERTVERPLEVPAKAGPSEEPWQREIIGYYQYAED